MAEKYPYYPLYVEDFDDDERVVTMNCGEVGLYILCLNRSWRYGSLPDDAEEVALLVRKKPLEVKKLWPAVRACYSAREDGRLVNRKQEEIRAEVADKSAKAKRSAEVGWQKRRRSESDANALPSQMDRTRNAMPRAFKSDSVSVSKEEIPSVALAENEPGYWVELWYQRHPKKRDLVLVYEPAAKLFDRGGVELMLTIDAIHKQKCVSEDWLRDGGRYVPTLSRWLEDRGWTENVGAAVPEQPKTKIWRLEDHL